MQMFAYLSPNHPLPVEQQKQQLTYCDPLIYDYFDDYLISFPVIVYLTIEHGFSM